MCSLLCPSLHEMFPWYLLFCWGDLYSFPFCCFSPFLCIDHWGNLYDLFLLFFGTLHSDVYIFSFILCFSSLFFWQLFVRPPQTAVLLFCIPSFGGWFWSPPPVQCYKPLSIVLWALCLLDLIPWIYLSLPLYKFNGLNLIIFVHGLHMLVAVY